MKNEKVSHSSQIAYVRRFTLTDGTEAGLRLIEVQNGKLRFLLNESKALDISQLWHEGSNVSFVSKNGLTAREIPFLRRFEGGMLYTCGLDSVGGREGHELHGNLHNTPARITRCDCSDTGITVQAEIRDSALFGQNLVLRRTVTTGIESDTVELTDELCNESYREEEYCLLYHVNLGYPFLDEGVEIVSDAASVLPRTPYAQKKAAERTCFPAPLPLEEERCYFITHKKPHIEAHNRKLGKHFMLDYSADTLPCFVQWVSPASGDYALGLEPCTTFLDDKFAYKALAPQSSARFTLALTVSDTKK